MGTKVLIQKGLMFRIGFQIFKINYGIVLILYTAESR